MMILFKRFGLLGVLVLVCAGTLKANVTVDQLTFTEVEGGYSVSRKEGATLQGNLSIPRYYQSKPIVQIGDNAFQSCCELTSVSIPGTVTSIGNGAFQDCWGLTSVDIPRSVTTIGESAFYRCEKLERVHIPEHVRIVNRATFAGCNNLKAVVFPNTLRVIEYGAFNGCVNLSEFVLPDSLRYIAAGGFGGCQNLPEIVLPENFTTLGDDAFSNTRIPKFHISDKLFIHELTAYGHPFSEAEVGEFTVSDNCERYSVYGSHLYTKDFTTLVCAAGMDSVTITNLHPDLTTITCSALSGCKDAVSLTLPAQVEQIGEHFYLMAMPNLRTIIFESVTPPTINDLSISDGLIERISLYVPLGTVNSYRLSNGWCEFPIYEYAPEYILYAPNVTSLPGDGCELEVGMKNVGDISSFQCDITLPEGLLVAENSKGKLDITLNGREGDHIISSKILSNGKLRVLSYSLSNDIFTGNEGPLFKICFDRKNSTPGTYALVIDNIHLSKPQGTDLALRPVTVSYMIDNTGDTNGDGELTITDAVGIVNHLLEVEQQLFFVDRSDVNCDGDITISDATQIIYNLLMESSADLSQSNAVRIPLRVDESSDYMSMSDLTISAGQSVPFVIGLHNQQTFTALQCDIKLPEGLSIPKNSKGKPIISLTERADESHILSCGEISQGVVRVAVLSMMSEDFTGDNGPILQFDIVCDRLPAQGAKIVVDNIHCTHNPGPVDVKLPAAECFVNAGEVSGIGDIQLAEGMTEVFSLQGVRISNTLTDLSPGLYIVRKNGVSSKILVR